MHDLYRKFPVLIGLRLADAIPIIKNRGFTPRFYQDGATKKETDNTFLPMRINLTITKGVVTGYTFL